MKRTYSPFPASLMLNVGIRPILHHQHTCCVMRMDGSVDEVNLIILPNDPVVSPALRVPRSNNHREISNGENTTSCEVDQPRGQRGYILVLSVCRCTSCLSGTQWLLVPKRIITQFLLTGNPTCIMAPKKSSVFQCLYIFF